MTVESAHVRDWVALVLAGGLTLALNLLMFAVLWDALRSDTPGLSENATQVIIAGFGGIVGILGGYLGARAVERGVSAGRDERRSLAEPAPGPTAPPAPYEPESEP